ncbi:hypothetical protein QOL99_10315 [Deinococcus sp. MIMF12]|uniref:Uncharacterized protein n=1 Tax=Deinococcus rhizophilus TaxID=3049544 RepID=A0ABT7JHK7_9DEIO|nr:hypothetical protein [Deinococcus rhizophilus]MDL2344549.1 hypothetical protein [Deinococcus rhizophilus]
MDARQNAEQVRQAGQPLRALALLERVVPEARAARTDEGTHLARQVLGFVQAEVGAHREALASFTFGTGSPGLSEPEERRVKEARLVDAVDAIVAASRGRRIVILNEAHHVPQSREFARRLALALRREGFSYFAGETFRPEIVSTTAQGYVTRDSGYYTAEPVYAELVRSVRRAGYTLVPYEAETFLQGGTPAQRINHRERQQAENLVERVFKKDPAARVFIFVRSLGVKSQMEA